MRYFITLLFGLILGPIAAFFSGLLVIGSSNKELETVGIISFKGFPFWFYESAPGISMISGWHIDRFIWNAVFWSILLGGFIFLILALTDRARKAEQGAAANP